MLRARLSDNPAKRPFDYDDPITTDSNARQSLFSLAILKRWHSFDMKFSSPVLRRFFKQAMSLQNDA